MMLLLSIVQHRVIPRIGSEGFLHLLLCHAEFVTVELGWYSYPIVILQILLYFFTLYFFNLLKLRSVLQSLKSLRTPVLHILSLKVHFLKTHS
jgi:hypothetical protein